MNKRIAAEANMRMKIDDTCVHVGDFCVRGGEKARDHLSRLTGNWVFIRGNHDKNNGVKTVCWWMMTQIGQYHAFVSHVPYFYRMPSGTAQYLVPDALVQVIEENCDFAICGHVHEKWMVSHEGKIPTINVGVDVHKFRPVRDDELINIYLKNRKATKTDEPTIAVRGPLCGCIGREYEARKHTECELPAPGDMPREIVHGQVLRDEGLQTA
jgi:calcineurin-like phosphoesterase family protein